MGVFLDTGFYLGLVHPDDPHSERSNEILLGLQDGKYGLLYTSNLVISELTTLVFIRTKGNSDMLHDVYDLIWGENKIATRMEITVQLENETWSNFIKYNSNFNGKKGFLSFVDASNIVLAKSKKIDYIVSFDEHFDGFITRIF